MTIPNARNIPELDFNFEGLKRHSYLCMLIPDVSLSDSERKLRSWLLHTLVTSARQYIKTRELVVLQNNTNQTRDGGVVFYIFDLSEQLEGCISATYRVCMAIKRMSNSPKNVEEFLGRHSETLGKLAKIRNQYEHMHSQIVTGEVGCGPISIILSDSGNKIKFRKVQLEVVSLYNLLKELYEVISSMYPQFDPNSKPEKGGPAKLSVTMDKVTKKA